MAEPITVFYTPVAARIARITLREIEYWAKTGLIIPSVYQSQGTGHVHQYDLADVLALRAVKHLRKSGISLQSLRKVAERLKEHAGASFANIYLTGDGKRDVLLRTEDDLVSMLRRPGQVCFTWVLDMGMIETAVRQEVAQLAKAA